MRYIVLVNFSPTLAILLYPLSPLTEMVGWFSGISAPAENAAPSEAVHTREAISFLFMSYPVLKRRLPVCHAVQPAVNVHFALSILNSANSIPFTAF